MSSVIVPRVSGDPAKRGYFRRRAFAALAAKNGRQADVREERQGWIMIEAATDRVAVHEALGVHEVWRGPAKCVQGAAGLMQRLEFPLPPHETADTGFSFAGTESQFQQTLHRGVFRAAGEMLARPADARLENRITSAALCTWIQAAGHATAVDERGNLRMAIAHGGFDGQMRIECGPERLRMSMALGCWSELPPLVESALLQLAAEANARIRLARIVWREDGPQRWCAAQVDMTGAPWLDEGNPGFEPTARHVLQMALSGMELCVRRLGRELAVMADPAHRDLAEAYIGQAAFADWPEAP
jgi:hypothetical protein